MTAHGDDCLDLTLQMVATAAEHGLCNAHRRLCAGTVGCFVNKAKQPMCIVAAGSKLSSTRLSGMIQTGTAA